jgi:hypothetical protein
MELSGRLHAPAALLSGAHRIGDWVVLRSGFYALGKTNLPFQELNPGRPSRSLITILTELSRRLEV